MTFIRILRRNRWPVVLPIYDGRRVTIHRIQEHERER